MLGDYYDTNIGIKTGQGKNKNLPLSEKLPKNGKLKLATRPDNIDLFKNLRLQKTG